MTAETDVVSTTAEETNHLTVFKWWSLPLPFWVTANGWFLLLVRLCFLFTSPVVEDCWRFHLVRQGLRKLLVVASF